MQSRTGPSSHLTTSLSILKSILYVSTQFYLLIQSITAILFQDLPSERNVAIRRSPRLRTDVSVAFPQGPGYNRQGAVYKGYDQPVFDVGLQNDNNLEFEHPITPTLKSPQIRHWLEGSPKAFTTSV